MTSPLRRALLGLALSTSLLAGCAPALLVPPERGSGDMGLVIEIFDLPDAPLFEGDTSGPSPIMLEITKLLAEVLALTTNEIAVNGHLRSYPVTLIDNPVWDLSADRAQVTRGMLEDAGVVADRMQRIAGFADRKPATTDPQALRNNRIEIILLRRDR